MRRKDREVADSTKIADIISRCTCCRIGLMKKNPNVGFEMDTDYVLHETDYACGHSARFQSIIGNGIVSIVSEAEEKKLGLSLLMEHQ